MRNIKIVTIILFITSILAGCSDIRDALSGIDDQAHKAASAISQEALEAKSINIEYGNESFTIDELFTTILRDTLWEYEKNDKLQIFTIKGTWKDGLFEENKFSDEMKQDLRMNGKVTIKLEIENGQINTESTKVTMKLKDNTIVEEFGEVAQKMLYEAFTINY
ncbi:hypothetical protein ACOQFO_15515 [Ureibacillus sp. MALMAid1270]|uniref:hypothetical protein n=1 Tax=Ureibacillus sp. MALMAid1270 TaxID=3411629 RepID=UPI003BA63984